MIVFQRYSPAARKVIPLACREAASRGAEVVAPEHLLLALSAVDESAPVLAYIGLGPVELREALDAQEANDLARIGISLDDVREQIEASFGVDVWDRPSPPKRRLRFSGATKQVLELTAREAAALGHTRIRAEHVLLAFAAANGPTRALLADLDVSPRELRERALGELRWTSGC